MKTALYIVAFLIAALVLPFFIPGAGEQPGVNPDADLPWQIDMDGRGGSRVFGLEPGRSTLAEVRQRFGGDGELAIVASPDEVGTLEAYYNQVTLGFVLARAIFTVDIEPEAIVAMRERALKAEHMESTTRKITLRSEDLLAAEGRVVKAFSIIPNVNLDEATVIQRFGPPGERIVVSDKRVHLLYPERGLDVVVDADGKELLQYVAPRDFHWLRDPLVASVSRQ